MLLCYFTFPFLCIIISMGTEISQKILPNFSPLLAAMVIFQHVQGNSIFYSQFSWVLFLFLPFSTFIKNKINSASLHLLPLSPLHNIQHLSHSPFLRAFVLQPLVVTVISLLPSSQVIDWPPLSKKSAVGSLKHKKASSIHVNECGKVHSNKVHIFCKCNLCCQYRSSW